MSNDRLMKYCQQMAFIDERTALLNALLELVPSKCSADEMRELLAETSAYLRAIQAVTRRREIRTTNGGDA